MSELNFKLNKINKMETITKKTELTERIIEDAQLFRGLVDYLNQTANNIVGTELDDKTINCRADFLERVKDAADYIMKSDKEPVRKVRLKDLR